MTRRALAGLIGVLTAAAAGPAADPPPLDKTVEIEITKDLPDLRIGDHIHQFRLPVKAGEKYRFQVTRLGKGSSAQVRIIEEKEFLKDVAPGVWKEFQSSSWGKTLDWEMSKTPPGNRIMVQVVADPGKLSLRVSRVDEGARVPDDRDELVKKLEAEVEALRKQNDDLRKQLDDIKRLLDKKKP